MRARRQTEKMAVRDRIPRCLVGGLELDWSTSTPGGPCAILDLPLRVHVLHLLSPPSRCRHLLLLYAENISSRPDGHGMSIVRVMPTQGTYFVFTGMNSGSAEEQRKAVTERAVAVLVSGSWETMSDKHSRLQVFTVNVHVLRVRIFPPPTMSNLPELPYIPLEVGENFIDQLSGRVRSLRSCALVCRGWNRHARYHLVAAIRVRSREDLYSICDYFTSNPRMASLVRTLSMSPAETKNRLFLLEVLPVDLLKRLPNLQRYSMLGERCLGSPSVSFHDTTLLHIKTYLHVEELNLDFLNFRTSVQLAKVLMALPQLRRLETGRHFMVIKTSDTSRYRDKCKMLTEVTVVGTFQAIAAVR